MKHSSAVSSIHKFSASPAYKETAEFFLSALGGDASLVRPLVHAIVSAAVVEGQVWTASSDEAGIIGVALWFGPGIDFLGS